MEKLVHHNRLHGIKHVNAKPEESPANQHGPKVLLGMLRSFYEVAKRAESAFRHTMDTSISVSNANPDFQESITRVAL